MNFLIFWNKPSSWKLWIWWKEQLRQKLWLTTLKFNRVLKAEIERNYFAKIKNKWKTYKFSQYEKDFWSIPNFDWAHDKRQMFREESAKHLARYHGKSYWFTFPN